MTVRMNQTVEKVMVDHLSSAQQLSTGELERLKELAAAGRHGVLKSAQLLDQATVTFADRARYVIARPAGLEAPYVITDRGRRALADVMT